MGRGTLFLGALLALGAALATLLLAAQSKGAVRALAPEPTVAIIVPDAVARAERQRATPFPHKVEDVRRSKGTEAPKAHVRHMRSAEDVYRQVAAYPWKPGYANLSWAPPIPLRPLEGPPAILARYRAEPGLHSLIRFVEHMAADLDLAPGARCVPRDVAHAGSHGGPLCAAPLLTGAAFARRFSFREFLACPEASGLSPPAGPAHHRDRYRYDAFPALEARGYKALADAQCDRGVAAFRKMLTGFQLSCRLPETLANRSLVYLNYDDLGLFRPQFLALKVHIFVIAGMHDHPRYPRWLLGSPNLLRLFSVNVERREVHPKVVPLPLGLMFNASRFVRATCGRAKEVAPHSLLLARFDLGGQNIQSRFGGRWLRRRPLVSYLRKRGFPAMEVLRVAERIPHQLYARMVLGHRFILCPAGEGLDSFRLWEALLMGRVPLLGDSLHPPDKGAGLPRQLLADLPHVYVSDWEPLRPAALLRRWEALANDSRPRFRLARLYMPWWAVHVLLRCLEVP